MSEVRKKNIDQFLCVLVILFIGIGFAAVLSASIFPAQRLVKDPYFFVRKQAAILTIGVFLIWLINKIKIDKLIDFSDILLMVFTALLGILFIPGIGKTANGATSWFSFLFFSFQPSEPLKIIIVLFLVKYFSRKRDSEDNGLWLYIKPVLLLIPALFLVILQPDLGTALLLILIIVTTLFLVGLPYKIIIGLPLLFAPLIYIFLYKIDKNWRRVMAFLDPFADPTSKGYQLVQSLSAFYYGGPWGRGLGNGIQKQFRLPESQTDFIYAALAEELGLLWSIGIILLFILLLVRTIQILNSLEKWEHRVLVFALLAIILIQGLINLAVVTGLMPVTGVPLPFISYGGSNLLTMMIIMGILCNISRQAVQQEET